MKKNILFWCLVVGIILLPCQQFCSLNAQAKTTNRLTSASVHYENNQQGIAATKDWATIKLNLAISQLKKTKKITLKMNKSIYSYSLKPFQVEDVCMITPQKNNTWEIRALKDIKDYTITLNIKLRYSPNLSADLEDMITFSLISGTDNSEKNVVIHVTKYLEKVKATELVRKVPLGFTKEGKIAWVIYFNYNQAGLSGSKETPYKFTDVVGEQQKLDIESIAAYDVKQPSIFLNGEKVRNTNHDTYNYDASHFFQQQATNKGIAFEAAKFQGIPTRYGYLPNTNAYYIYLETTPDNNTISGTVFSNYTYMRISYIGVKAWEDEDQALITADKSSSGTAQFSIILEKLDATTKAKLPDAEFQLLNQDTHQIIGKHLTTNQFGRFILPSLPAGHYQLVETKAPPGYILDPKPVSFTVQAKQSNVIHLRKTNQRKIDTGDLTIQKIDQDDHFKKLAGAEFTLYYADGKIARKGVTTQNGELKFTNLARNKTYRLIETKAPKNYKLDATVYHISYAKAKNKVLHCVITNQKIKTNKYKRINEVSDPKDSSHQIVDPIKKIVTKSQALPKCGEIPFFNSILPVILGLMCAVMATTYLFITRKKQ